MDSMVNLGEKPPDAALVFLEGISPGTIRESLDLWYSARADVD